MIGGIRPKETELIATLGVTGKNAFTTTEIAKA
jgi:hypothetical protein